MRKMEVLAIWIEDQEVALADVMPFYKLNPYPGDHKYKLKLSFKSVSALEKALMAELSSLNNVNWELFFLYLQGFCSENRSDNCARYLLNTVDRVEHDGTNLTLYGVCSTIINDFEKIPGVD